MIKFATFILVFAYSSFSLGAQKNPFDVLKSLKGEWSIASGKKTMSIKMAYDLGSNNSILTERFGKELSVFSKDGEKLILTHFCNRGHQSRLELKPTKSSKKFEFKMFDLLNHSNAKAPHVDKIIYKVRSKNKVSLEIVWNLNGKNKSEKYKLVRL